MLDYNKLKECVDNNLSSYKITEKFGCTQMETRYWLKKFKLKTHPKYTHHHKDYLCISCGTTNSSSFYGHMRSLCKCCFNRKTIEKDKQIRDEIMFLLGGKCVRCGITDYRVLQIDHVHNNGKEERKSNSDRKLLKIILNKIKNGSVDYQLLCANDHVIKTIYE
jgi:hypothetical protein